MIPPFLSLNAEYSSFISLKSKRCVMTKDGSNVPSYDEGQHRCSYERQTAYLELLEQILPVILNGTLTGTAEGDSLLHQRADYYAIVSLYATVRRAKAYC